MGLLAIDGVGLDNSASHNASYGILRELSSAKTPPQATGKWQELYLKATSDFSKRFSERSNR